MTIKKDIYKEVTEKIIAASETETGEWRCPWSGHADIPMNANTENRYHGINTVTLWAEAMRKGYETGYWASFKQWRQIGGQVQRGEKSTPVVFYKPLRGSKPKTPKIPAP